MSEDNFDIKQGGKRYTRCKECRIKHNENVRVSYEPTRIKFSSYEGLTPLGKRKVDCWDTEKNGDISPKNVFKMSHKKYWFICDNPDCTHSFNIALSKITGMNRWCPYCSNQKLCQDENCSCCLNKSLASFKGKTPCGNLKVDYFDKIKNENINVRYIFKGSVHTKYWFICDNPECRHSFESSPSAISSEKDTWCPYCANKKLCEDITCLSCYNKTFSSYEGLTRLGNKKVDCWDTKKNGVITPRNVFKMSHKKYWFICDNPDCGHSFEMSLSSTGCNKRCWCPYCCFPTKKLCEDENCIHCFNRSFASYEGLTFFGNSKVGCWDINKNKGSTPRNVCKSTDTKYWFICDNLTCKYCFDASMTNIIKGKWCPNCKNKTELKLYNFLKTIYPDTFRQYSPEWCINPNTKTRLRFDFYIPSLNVIIELDGPQHFIQVSTWKSPEYTQSIDKYKMIRALQNNISTYRLLQTEVLMDSFDWKTKLLEELEKNNLENVCICICQSGDYPAYNDMPNLNDITNEYSVSLLSKEFNDDDIESEDELNNILIIN